MAAVTSGSSFWARRSTQARLARFVAYAVVTILAILAVTLVQLMIARLWVYYEAEQPTARGGG